MSGNEQSNQKVNLLHRTIDVSKSCPECGDCECPYFRYIGVDED